MGHGILFLHIDPSVHFEEKDLKSAENLHHKRLRRTRVEIKKEKHVVNLQLRKKITYSD